MAKKGKGAGAQSSARSLAEVVRAKFGKYSALVADKDTASKITGYLSTGVAVLDRYVIGAEGLPETKFSEVFAEEGACKSSLGLSALAATQRAGGVSVLIDSEYTFDSQRAADLGVDLKELLVVQPEHLEELFEQVKALLAAHDGKRPMLIVWDSVAATNTKNGLVLEAGETGVGEVPRLMSNELKKLLDPLANKRAHLMMINQIRSKIGVMFGSNITTPGGNAPKFYSYLRLWIVGGKAIKNSRKEHTGKILTILAPKNKCGPPWRKARVRFDYATGWDDAWSTVQHAVTMKLVDPRGEKGRKRPLLETYPEACQKLGWPARDDLDLVALDAGGAAEEESDDD